MAQLRTLARSWFGTSGTQIDFALARGELQVRQCKRTKQLLDKALRAHAQGDPDQVSEVRADGLLIRAQLHATNGQHVQASHAASIAPALNEQIPASPEDYWERQELLSQIIKASKEPSSK